MSFCKGCVSEKMETGACKGCLAESKLHVESVSKIFKMNILAKEFIPNEKK